MLKDVDTTIAYPNTTYRRTKRRKLLIASRMWVVHYRDEAAPCQLCAGARIAARNIIEASYSKEIYAICSKCLGEIGLERERTQPAAEKALYRGKSVASRPKRSGKSTTTK